MGVYKLSTEGSRVHKCSLMALPQFVMGGGSPPNGMGDDGVKRRTRE